MDDETIIEAPNADAPVACTLTNDEAAKQALEWVDLRSHAIEAVAIANGARLTLPASLAADVEDLSRREASCCAFLSIETTIVGDALILEIFSPNPDALPVIAALAGIAGS